MGKKTEEAFPNPIFSVAYSKSLSNLHCAVGSLVNMMDGTNNSGIRSDATSLSAFDETIPEKPRGLLKGKTIVEKADGVVTLFNPRFCRFSLPYKLQSILRI